MLSRKECEFSKRSNVSERTVIAKTVRDTGGVNCYGVRELVEDLS